MQIDVKNLVEGGRLIGAEPWYRNVDEVNHHGEKTKIVPEICNFVQSSWPAERDGACFFDFASKLFLKISGGTGQSEYFEIVVLSFFRAMDCRLTEILYYLGLYPESNWVNHRTWYSFYNKLELFRSVTEDLPVPNVLIKMAQDLRNDIEHHFGTCDLRKLKQVKEIVELLFHTTDRLIAVLKEFSYFEFALASSKIGIQIHRDGQGISVFPCPFETKNLSKLPVLSGKKLAPEGMRVIQFVVCAIAECDDQEMFVNGGTPPRDNGPDKVVTGHIDLG